MKNDRIKEIVAAQILLAVAQEDAKAPTSSYRIRLKAWLAQVARRELADLGGLPA